MEEGWIKLHRQFLDWEWHDSPETVTLFVHLLIMANHEGKKWHGQDMSRGQVLTSRDRLSQLTGLSVQQVRTCLGRLEKTGEINQQTTNKYSVITISNYDKYQVREEANQPALQQTNNQQSTTNKNERIYNIYNSLSTRTREDWRYLSSTVKASLGFDKDRIAEYKGGLFRQQVEELAPQVGMTSQQVDAFVRCWTEHRPGNERIRAELQDTFDVRGRMERWMEKERPATQQQQQAKPKSRMEAYEEDMKFIHDYFHGQQQTVTTPDEQ